MQFLSKNGKPHLKSVRLIYYLSFAGVLDYNNLNIENFICQILFHVIVAYVQQLVNVLYAYHYGTGVLHHP